MKWPDGEKSAIFSMWSQHKIKRFLDHPVHIVLCCLHYMKYIFSSAFGLLLYGLFKLSSLFGIFEVFKDIILNLHIDQPFISKCYRITCGVNNWLNKFAPSS